jgi:hypothetical protein
VWSTSNAPLVDGSGDSSGRYFIPAEADTPIGERDGKECSYRKLLRVSHPCAIRVFALAAWFWKPGQVYRPLDELKAVYRRSVGANSFLKLGVIPDKTGNIPADQMELLQGLGDYIRTCHSPAAALASSSGTAASLTLTFPLHTVDRIMLQEDLAFGQLVRAFTVTAQPEGGWLKQPVLLAEGTSVGNKRILYFSSGPIVARSITVKATSLYPGVSAAHWQNVAVFAPCALEYTPAAPRRFANPDSESGSDYGDT